MQHGPLTRAGILGTVLVAIVAAGCIRLGLWQLDRLETRKAYNVAVESRIREPVLQTRFPAGSDTVGLIHRRVSITGTYDNGRAIVLPGRALNGLPGVHLVTPLRVAGSHDAILVNRGWIPSSDGATIVIEEFDFNEPATIEALIIPFPGRPESLASRSAPSADSAFKRVWYRIDPAQLRGQFPYPLANFMVQQITDGPGHRYPIPARPPALDNGPHLGYAVQWFSFASIAVIGWFVLVLRRKNPAVAARGPDSTAVKQ